MNVLDGLHWTIDGGRPIGYRCLCTESVYTGVCVDVHVHRCVLVVFITCIVVDGGMSGSTLHTLHLYFVMVFIFYFIFAFWFY